MGYDYYFLVGLGGVPPEIREAEDPREELQAHFEMFRKVYDALKDSDWFPCVGVEQHSSASGYGTGPKAELLPAFQVFTEQFPSFTFVLYLVCWDCTQMYAWRLQGLKDDGGRDGPVLDLDGARVPVAGRVWVRMPLEGTAICNDLTGVLESEANRAFVYDETALEPHETELEARRQESAKCDSD